MICRLGLTAIRLLLRERVCPKNRIDDVLSRGEEDEEDRELEVPEYEAQDDISVNTAKKTTFKDMYRYREKVIVECWPHVLIVMPKISSMLLEFLHIHGGDANVMEQWCLLVLHVCSISAVGLAGMREAHGGDIVERVQKMQTLHVHSVYMQALCSLCVETLEVKDEM